MQYNFWKLQKTGLGLPEIFVIRWKNYFFTIRGLRPAIEILRLSLM